MATAAIDKDEAARRLSQLVREHAEQQEVPVDKPEGRDALSAVTGIDLDRLDSILALEQPPTSLEIQSLIAALGIPPDDLFPFDPKDEELLEEVRSWENAGFAAGGGIVPPEGAELRQEDVDESLARAYHFVRCLRAFD
jgi:hypothetical protein